MFDPVWLGNSIVPLWEALLLVGGSIILVMVAALCAALGMVWLACRVLEQTLKKERNRLERNHD